MVPLSLSDAFDIFCRTGCIDGDRGSDRGRNDVELNQFNIDKMIRHILECVCAVNDVSHMKQFNHRHEYTDDDKFSPKAKMQLFSAAFKYAMMHDLPGSVPVGYILKAFRNVSDLKNSDNWLPLHWAVAAIDEVGEDIVKTIYLSNPVALSETFNSAACGMRYTSLHILLMSPNSNLNLIRYFGVTNPMAFEKCALDDIGDEKPYYALHAAAEYCTTIEPLQLLLQICPTHACISDDERYGYPLCKLVKRYRNSSVDLDKLFERLVQTDHSVQVIGDTMQWILDKISSRLGKVLTDESCQVFLAIFKKLMAANAAVALEYRGSDGEDEDLSLLHFAANVDGFGAINMELLNLVLAANPDAVRIRSSWFCLPIHTAVFSSNINAANIIVDVYALCENVLEQTEFSIKKVAM